MMISTISRCVQPTRSAAAMCAELRAGGAERRQSRDADHLSRFQVEAGTAEDVSEGEFGGVAAQIRSNIFEGLQELAGILALRFLQKGHTAFETIGFVHRSPHL
jgi:hypothetical protein